MIERVHGKVIYSSDKTITVMTGGIGFGMQVVDQNQFASDTLITVYTYEHWNAEKGPALYGFVNEASRQLFCLLISCSKIGPSIALALLRQREVSTLVHDILSGNITGLSSCQGIGSKKAELIVYELKDKVGGLMSSHAELQGVAGLSLKQMQEALLSLSYSKQEASQAIQYVANFYKGESLPEVNVLLRKALAFLSAPRE